MRWPAASLAALVAAAALAVACGDDKPASTVNVKLDNYTIAPDKAAVPAGKVTFIATNVHATDVHELAVMEKRPDGSLKNLGEIEDLGAGKAGNLTLSLKRGDYLLACLIAIGQEGSKVDHFQSGMHLDFKVN